MIKTLETMAEIYRLPREGGADSPRFQRYRAECEHLRPLAAYNPMTGLPETLATIDMLRSIDAERLVQEAFDTTGLVADPLDLAVVVLTEGAWTDRLFTEVRYRREGIDAVWFWSGEPCDEGSVVAAARAEAVRVAWRRAHGPAESLWEFAAQEGLAQRLADCGLRVIVPEDHEHVREVLDVVGTEVDDHTLIAFTFGDELTEARGWQGLGLSGAVGVRVCADRAPGVSEVPAAIRHGWSPF